MKHQLGVKYLPLDSRVDWTNAIIVFHDEGFRQSDAKFLVLFNNPDYLGRDNYKEMWMPLVYIDTHISLKEYKEDFVEIRYENKTLKLDVNLAIKRGVLK